jgi:hypothetical protein|tara:strand:+ start:631 stop:1002 length:372 start_codon:yes stop_codon:yes gene_type:complete
MAKKIDIVGRRQPKIGTLLFGFGAALAVAGGLIYPGGLNTILSSVLIALGIIVGMLNVTLRETNSFLLATVSLVVMSALGGAVLSQVPSIGIYVEGILLSILTFILPAGIIVALRTVYRLAED